MENFAEEMKTTHHVYATKAVQLAADIERMEESYDKIQKVNIWLMRRYRKDLIEEFSDEKIKEDYSEIFNLKNADTKGLKEALIVSHLFDRIAEEMNKEMPLPWYMYGFGSLEA